MTYDEALAAVRAGKRVEILFVGPFGRRTWHEFAELDDGANVELLDSQIFLPIDVDADLRSARFRLREARRI